MKKNAAAAAKDVQILPPNPPVLQRQIEGTSKQSVETAKKAIEASCSYAQTPLSFPVSAPLINFWLGLWDSKLSADVFS